MRHLLLAVLISAPAFAQVFSWEDKDGVHYTNDVPAVPKGAKVTKVGEDDATVQQPANVVEVAAAPRPSSSPPSPANPSVEREWRDRFIQLNRAITTRKQELAALEASLPNKVDCVPQPRAAPVANSNGQVVPQQQVVTRCLPNAMYDGIKLQIEQKRVELKDAENDLEQLDRRASFEAVPREWRRGW